MLFMAGTWVLGSKSLCLSKRNKDRRDFFAGKAFLSILQNEQILSLCLARRLAKAAWIAIMTIETIDYSKMGFIPCNSMKIYTFMFLK